MEKDNIIATKSLEFGIAILAFVDALNSIGQTVIAKQIVRSGTSIGANIWEAQEASSKADFVHKVKLALKEANETLYWLKLCEHLPGKPESDQLMAQLWEMKRIMSKIIITSKNSMTRKSVR
jgi:four helix bundle protein